MLAPGGHPGWITDPQGRTSCRSGHSRRSSISPSSRLLGREHTLHPLSLGHPFLLPHFLLVRPIHFRITIHTMSMTRNTHCLLRSKPKRRQLIPQIRCVLENLLAQVKAFPMRQDLLIPFCPLSAIVTLFQLTSSILTPGRRDRGRSWFVLFPIPIDRDRQTTRRVLPLLR